MLFEFLNPNAMPILPASVQGGGLFNIMPAQKIETEPLATLGQRILKDLENLSAIDENYQISLVIFRKLHQSLEPRITS